MRPRSYFTCRRYVPWCRRLETGRLPNCIDRGDYRASEVSPPSPRRIGVRPIKSSVAGALVLVLLPLTAVSTAHNPPYLDSRLSTDRRVADLMRRMTLDD